MEKTLVKEVYDFKNVTSVSEGYTINAFDVTIKDGKVQSCRGEVTTSDNGMFTFSVYEQTKMSKVERAFMLNNVSEAIDAHAIVKDFLTFVEEDIKANN